jgi:hypothetical protein
MPNTTTLADLFNDAALLSLEHRWHLGEIVGDHNWRVNLDEPWFEFIGERPLTCRGVHLLGSADPHSESWLWAWANPAGYSEEVTRVSAHLRDQGEELGIPELARAQLPFGTLPLAQRRPDMFALQLTEAAKTLSGHWTSYIADAGQGTYVACLIEHPAFTLPAPTLERTLQVVAQGVLEPSVSDQRRAVISYATRRGLGQQADGTSLSLVGADFGLTVCFDDQGRVSSIASFSLTVRDARM